MYARVNSSCKRVMLVNINDNETYRSGDDGGSVGGTCGEQEGTKEGGKKRKKKR